MQLNIDKVMRRGKNIKLTSLKRHKSPVTYKKYHFITTKTKISAY